MPRTLSHLNRDSIWRVLEAEGLSRRRPPASDRSARGKGVFRGYDLGCVRIDIKHLPKLQTNNGEHRKRYLFVAIGRRSRSVHLAVKDDETEQSAIALTIASAPAASCTLAVVRLTISSRPSVSTTTCRLRPFTFLAVSYPPPPGTCGALIVWLSTTPALGLARDPPARDKHRRQVVDCLEQQATHQTPEPPIHRLPRPEMHRQHAPAPAGARHVTDRVQGPPQVHPRLPAAPGSFR